MVNCTEPSGLVVWEIVPLPAVMLVGVREREKFVPSFIE
jgi:hypothetical protein